MRRFVFISLVFFVSCKSELYLKALIDSPYRYDYTDDAVKIGISEGDIPIIIDFSKKGKRIFGYARMSKSNEPFPNLPIYAGERIVINEKEEIRLTDSISITGKDGYFEFNTEEIKNYNYIVFHYLSFAPYVIEVIDD